MAKRLFFPFLSLFLSLISFTSTQDFEISPEILLAGSPAAMLFAFLETQDDFTGPAQTLNAISSVCKTQGLDFAQNVASAEPPVDCNLTGVDPECFLINLAGQVGTSWGTQMADEQKAADMIAKLLKSPDMTLKAAVAACAAAPIVIPLLAHLGTEMNPPAQVIADATMACKA